MDPLLLLKLGLAPLLIAAASVVAGRAGPRAGGWVVGLPLTTGPVAVVLALQEGAPFVDRLAVGSLAGVAAQAAFAATYGRRCARAGWPPALVAASAAFATTAAALLACRLSTPALAACALASLPLGLRAAPQADPPPVRRGSADLPLRMALAAALVLVITTLAPLTGPRAGGALTCFPLMGALLTVFAHREHGPLAAIAVCRGMLAGLFSFLVFALTLPALIAQVS
jgi:hypothetical protein